MQRRMVRLRSGIHPSLWPVPGSLLSIYSDHWKLCQQVQQSGISRKGDPGRPIRPLGNSRCQYREQSEGITAEWPCLRVHVGPGGKLVHGIYEWNLQLQRWSDSVQQGTCHSRGRIRRHRPIFQGQEQLGDLVGRERLFPHRLRRCHRRCPVWRVPLYCFRRLYSGRRCGSADDGGDCPGAGTVLYDGPDSFQLRF